MTNLDINKIEYKVFDPAKNITLLVETEVPIKDQAEVAKRLLEKEKEVEQVGFISHDDIGEVTLRMAGGEFCGNATMCIAAYQALKGKQSEAAVKVHILDMNKIIDVEVKNNNDGSWLCKEILPYVPEVSYIDIGEFNDLPLVTLDGISHIVFENNESVPDIRAFCDKLKLSALGFMFYEKETSKLTPLVYVKKVDTLFWEKSCASGTIAIGAYLADKEEKYIEKNIRQPGGELKILAEPKGKLVLEGKVIVL